MSDGPRDNNLNVIPVLPQNFIDREGNVHFAPGRNVILTNFA
jgi:hypothetical protein